MELRKRLGCLHAHYSNIEYIENAFSTFNIELIHFVDPALMYRVTFDENYQESDAQNKVKEQIEWIAQCNVDAILITCTNYIAILQEDQLSISVPIIKIDEPFFEFICSIQQPQTILFTNPATVEGTMERLKHYANNQKKSLNVEVIVINNTFELIMQGLKEEYNQEISKFLEQIINDKNKVISVAQLSMVDASQQVEDKTSKTIINPLKTLVSSIVNQLELGEKNQ
ncbi:aspartate/glutamate racemase family protein [Ureibacillus sp. GCM10028918]|uniref:aspartate/glutamate racemase family protein n=1 Tax=Ureibacillus sp. GCM10028918 TaxID=3273429 RepID=UPI0036230CB4